MMTLINRATTCIVEADCVNTKVANIWTRVFEAAYRLSMKTLSVSGSTPQRARFNIIRHSGNL
jgi:hypothetical protein